MNLNQLEYFRVLAKEEHYTKAAQMLSITQPSLSHAIAMLEQELNTKLFEKKGRNIVLTKYGKTFLPYVEEALGVLEDGVKKTRNLNATNEGEINLGYIYTLGSNFAPSMVRGFLDSHPDYHIDFHFTVGATSEMIEGLKNDRFDLVFASYQEKEPEVVFSRIGNQKLVVVVPNNHPLAGRASIRLQETIPYPQVYFSRNSGLRPVIDQLFEKINVFPKIVFEMEEDSSMAGLVAQNFGIAVMPEIPILKTLEVTTIAIESPEYERYVYLAKKREHYMPPVVKEFEEYVLNKTAAFQNDDNANSGCFLRTV